MSDSDNTKADKILPSGLRPWVKGQSGNPGGLPKAVKEVRKAALSMCPEALERLQYWLRSDDSRASVAAALAILDRGMGKPVAAEIVEKEEVEDYSTLSEDELVAMALGKVS